MRVPSNVCLLASTPLCFATLPAPWRLHLAGFLGPLRGGSTGFSVPIAKGVRFRTGAFRAKSVVVGTSLEVADTGMLTITSRRAVYKGLRKTVETPFTRLIGVNVFNDGIQLHASNRQNAPLSRVADGYLVAAVVNAAWQRLT